VYLARIARIRSQSGLRAGRRSLLRRMLDRLRR